MPRLPLGAFVIGGASALLVAGALGACSVSDATSGSNVVGPDAGRPSEAGTPPPDGGGTDAGAGIDANAIVLVHAASFPAFRICFEGAVKERPMPSAELMPEANVVGIDVGTALVFPPRSEILGKAFVFMESFLRPLDPLVGDGPTCEALLGAGGTKSAAIEVGEIKTSLARGVHALVLGGCRAAAADPMASTERCGDEWDPARGNLALRTIALPAYGRFDPSQLPVQLLQLSPSLARSAAGRALGVAFGPVDESAATMAFPVVEGAVPFATPVPNPPVQLAYDAADLASFANMGVYLTLGGAVDDAGAPVDADAGTRELVLVQSLADIQKRSAPRSVPPDWFASRSSYIVLSVGERDPRIADGGPDDDPRRALHLLAIPLATPDAGRTAAP